MKLNSKKKTEADYTKRRKVVSAVTIFLSVIIMVCAVIIYNYMKTEFDVASKNSFTMGTVVTVRLYGDENNYVAKGTVNELVDSLDKVISWRHSEAATAQLNKNLFVQNSAVSDIVNTCRKISDDSDGAFDLTIGNVSKLWNFDSDSKEIPDDNMIKEALKSVDYKSLEVSGIQVECKKGQSVDLGSVGKGYACDVVKAFLEKSDVKGAVVSVGGSIVAYGNRNRAGDKWRVAIRDPQNEQGYIGTVNIDEGFVSTSGDYEKYFEKDGKKYHHLLDARTGYPAQSDLTSVTIICDSGLMSDALSTACYVLGKEQGMKLAEKYNVGAVFIDKQMDISTVGEVDFERLVA